MDRRIYGVETEYGITCAGGDLDAEAAARELFAPLIQRGRTTNMFLPNGGRLYLDVGAHPEYATAECDNLWDLLAQDRAGSQLLSDLATEANGRLEAGRIHLFRNNFDFDHNSFGCHENYLLRRRRDFREVADALVAYFVTRQVVAGAGDLKRNPEGQLQYVFSARADQMFDSVSAATTRARPIINTRDEPLADATEYRRMHVIVGDSNMAEPTTALKVGATGLLLDAVDRGIHLADLALADPIEAIQAINFDLSGQLLLPMQDGRQLRAVDIQQEVLDRILGLEPELSEMQRYLVGLWQRAIEAVRSGNWAPIETEIDFAIKKRLVDQYRERSGAELADPRVARLLLSYHDITEAGLRGKLEAGQVMLRLTSPEQVTVATTTPPPTTRAHLRGRVIAAAERNRRDLACDWIHLRLEDGGLNLALQDPFATESEAVDQLIAAIEQSSPQLPA